MLQIQPSLRSRRSQIVRIVKKTLKRVVAFALAIYFIPWVLLGYLVLGLIDVRRNTPRTWRTVDRYFAGNGVFTWLLSPFNLLMDVLWSHDRSPVRPTVGGSSARLTRRLVSSLYAYGDQRRHAPTHD
jgi:hypothetical protein